MAETIVETKACKHCGASFTITDKDLEFYDKISPIFAGKRYAIPSPTFCPNCRQQRRLAFRNERKLYKRTCNLTGKDIVSIYPPDSDYKIYSQKEWLGDGWDAMSYGRDFDFNLSFSQQFDALLHEVPRASLYGLSNENSDFNNYTDHCKNTYLCFFSNTIENSYYINGSCKIYDSIDIGWSEQVEHSYECFNNGTVFKCFYCNGCDDSSDLFMCANCMGCKNCFGCVGLRNKQYFIFNTPHTEEGYLSEVEKLHKMNLQEIREKVHGLQLIVPVLALNIGGSKNCVGDFIYNSSNCSHCYEVGDMSDAKYACQCARTHDVYDADNTGDGEGMLLDVLSSDDCFHVAFCMENTHSNYIYCSNLLLNCNNCFGCVGLRNKEYCILNKQYTQEEYEKMVSKIIEKMIVDGERGEFFSPTISTSGYNETLAQDYFPLTRDEALAKGYKWQDKEYTVNIPENAQTIKAQDLSENISDIGDDILNKVIICEITNKPFRIIKPELEFYRKHNLSLPRKHPDQRHLERMAMRNPRKLRERKCAKCSADIKTTYAPERPEIVYCESCYAKAIYG